jgi:molecular chaperone GrpE (heat shock protein)
MLEDVKPDSCPEPPGAGAPLEGAPGAPGPSAAAPADAASEAVILGDSWVIRRTGAPPPAVAAPEQPAKAHGPTPAAQPASAPEPQAAEAAEASPQDGASSEELHSVPSPEPIKDEPEDELSAWKAALRGDVETWLEGLEEIPEPEELDEQAPDLYSFYEQLAAASAENRKANRRTAEAISLWGDTVARFDEGLRPLRESIAQLTAAQPKAGELSPSHCLALLELLDRLERIAGAFQNPPPRKSWFASGGQAAWRRAWQAQEQAVEIVLSHIEDLLKREGLTRIETAGRPFDPAVMTAVSVDPNVSRPVQTVIEEIAPGYQRRGELLRSAQVKVSRRPEEARRL